MKKKKIIEEIVKIVKHYNLTPTEFRYVVGEVRKSCNLQIPKRAKKLPDFLNSGEIYFLLNNEKNMLTQLLMEFLIFTGLRISEARNIMIQDIDFNNDQLKVIQGKGHKDRYVPLTSNLGQKLKLYLQERKRGYLFTKKNNMPFTKRALQKRVSQSLNSCGFNKVLSTHSLRHTFACLCLARGITIEKIKLFMGHSSIKTTEVYAKLELGSVKEEFLSLMDYRG